MSDSGSFILTVDVAPVPPILIMATPADDIMTAGDLYRKTVSVTYTGTNPLTYSATGLPGSLSINPATGEISGLLTESDVGSHGITVTVSDGALPDASDSFTLTVQTAIVTPPVTDHTIQATAGAGGNISPSGNVQVADGDSCTFTIAANSGYYISGVTVDGQSVGAVSSYQFDNVTANHTIRAAFAQTTTTTSRDRDSGDSSVQDTVRITVPSTLVVDAAKAKAALAEMQKSGANKARIRHNGEIKALTEVWAVFGTVPVDFDTVDGDGVQVRVTVREPGKMTGEKLLSGYVKGSIVDSRKALFEKWFKNKVRVIHLDQQTSWVQPDGARLAVEIAAKVDLTGMDTTNLYFYSYDKATNTYHRIENPAYWIDKNGYLHFTTEYAGDIIVSEGSLERK